MVTIVLFISSLLRKKSDKLKFVVAAGMWASLTATN